MNGSAPNEIQIRQKIVYRLMRIPSALLVFLCVLVVVLLAANSSAQSETEREIEKLKGQIDEIQRQNQRQVEELKRRIDELESKRRTESKAVDEVSAETEEGISWLENIRAGYDEGFFLKTKDDNFSLKFNAFFQFQFFIEDFDDERNAEPDVDVSFQIRRLRLYFTGNAFRPWLRYTIQLAADRGSRFELRDAYIDLAYYERAKPRFGQFKVPFNREELTSDSAIQFVDRSIVNDEFTLERDIGAMLHGGLFDDILEYGVGIFNGTGRNVDKNEDSDLLYAARVTIMPFGRYLYSQMYSENPEKPLLALGAAVAFIPGFNPVTEGSSNRENLADAVLEINPDVTDADVFQFTADFAFKYLGFTAEAEYNLRHISPDIGDDTTGHGLRVQAGYFIIPWNLLLAFRYGIVDPDAERKDDIRQEFTPAMGFYFFEQRIRITADYSLLLERNQNGGDFKDHRFRLQTAVYF